MKQFQQTWIGRHIVVFSTIFVAMISIFGAIFYFQNDGSVTDTVVIELPEGITFDTSTKQLNNLIDGYVFTVPNDFESLVYRDGVLSVREKMQKGGPGGYYPSYRIITFDNDLKLNLFFEEWLSRQEYASDFLVEKLTDSILVTPPTYGFSQKYLFFESNEKIFKFEASFMEPTSLKKYLNM